ncbi:MAG TPA: CpsD/CapB family tyrosine-protein kinase [Capsulimonadaceae bacterium]|jgi:Mrp family chromosome partitioning ATPase
MADYTPESSDTHDLESTAANGDSFVPGDSYRPVRGGYAPIEPATISPGEPIILPVRTEQSPPEFVHLQSAIESHLLDISAPSAVSISSVAEDGLDQDRPYVLGVSSAVQGEGKTTTAIHLAITMAQNSYKRICLMDFSLAQTVEGDLAHRLGLYVNRSVAEAAPRPSGPTRGIVDVLEETSHSVSTFQLSEPDNLTIIPAGRPSLRPARCARSPRVPQLISSARHVFDVIIVDMPAIATEYATPMMRYLDGVMLVVYSGTTPRQMVQQAIEVVGREKVVGVALNRYKTNVPGWLMRKLRL